MGWEGKFPDVVRVDRFLSRPIPIPSRSFGIGTGRDTFEVLMRKTQIDL